MEYCYICFDQTEEEMVCDTCEEHYCEDCSYIFSLHYQFQGSRCYMCADQSREYPLDKAKIRERKINLMLEEND